MAKTYWEKLKDPRWQRKRLEILNMADFTCEKCGASDKTLNVHHKRYRKGADPWDYEDHELASICEDCHRLIHELESHHLETMDELEPDSAAAVRGFAKTLAVLANRFAYPDDAPITFGSRGSFLGAMRAVGVRPSEVSNYNEYMQITAGELRSMAQSNGVETD